MITAGLLATTALTPAKIKSVHVVVNPASGGRVGLRTLEEIVIPRLQEAGIECKPLYTEYAGHALEFAEKTSPLLDAFLAIGGDGTAHEIANGMLRRPAAERVPIGVIPAGSGNSWSADIGLDTAEDACAAIAEGSMRAVDIMRVTLAEQALPRYSVNICAWGLPAAVLVAANELRSTFGTAQYDLAGLWLILQGRASFSCELTYVDPNGNEVTRTCDDVSFVQGQINARMGKRVNFAPDAVMDDGLLDLVLISKSALGSGAAIISSQALAQYADGSHTQLPFVEVIRCRSFSVTPRKDSTGAGSDVSDSDVNLDGELLTGAAPFHADCVQRGLTVLGRQSACRDVV